MRLLWREFSSSRGYCTWTGCLAGCIKHYTSRHKAVTTTVARTMEYFLSVWATLVAICTLTAASVGAVAVAQRDGPEYETFTSTTQPGVGLRFIRNSGVCETTPGVGQLSGYIDFGQNMSMVCPLVFTELNVAAEPS